MAGQITANSVQLGDSATATQNFVLQTNVDGTATLARGNAGATTQDILTIDANGIVMLEQGSGRMVLSTAQATTSGTAIDFTGIPSWVKRITVMFNGVSTNGTSNLLVQLGDSGGIENTGYVSSSEYASSSAQSTAGFIIFNGAAANISTGLLTIISSSVTTYISQHVINVSNPIIYGAGSKTLSESLTTLRITTVNGTDTFDAGSVNIMYEG